MRLLGANPILPAYNEDILLTCTRVCIRTGSVCSRQNASYERAGLRSSEIVSPV